MKIHTLEICHVTKKFREVTALKDVSMHCESGRIYGIVGHNGSGKTVLQKCICGFYTCDSGKIMVDGQVMGKDLDMLNNAGVIIEEPAFLRKDSGYHNLEFLYSLRKSGRSHKEERAHLYEVMRTTGLDPTLKRPVGKYSLGMRQRLAIAQAIMEDPDIMILDEPMNGLDKKGVSEMRDLFLKMKEQGKLILLASHNREDIEVLCDEVYEMEDGVLSRQSC